MWRTGLQFAITYSEHNQIDCLLPQIYVRMKCRLCNSGFYKDKEWGYNEDSNGRVPIPMVFACSTFSHPNAFPPNTLELSTVSKAHQKLTTKFSKHEEKQSDMLLKVKSYLPQTRKTSAPNAQHLRISTLMWVFWELPKHKHYFPCLCAPCNVEAAGVHISTWVTQKDQSPNWLSSFVQQAGAPTTCTIHCSLAPNIHF